ncbi:hypothetical protein CDEST_12379 [Colletotrichum destructivum]|uniref:Uncharacterized protein n=1 Tax=Colletotrichum destructivum TaxID=34406 RepID=A0AAX4IVV9_9PEZI|nr:hypothetical protein CDEST_12379 [Colletotrichum destructivum]
MLEQLFPVERSCVDISGAPFKANRRAWTPVLEEFDKNLREVSSEGDEVSKNRHQERGQLLRTSTLQANADSKGRLNIAAKQLETGLLCYLMRTLRSSSWEPLWDSKFPVPILASGRFKAIQINSPSNNLGVVGHVFLCLTYPLRAAGPGMR